MTKTKSQKARARQARANKPRVNRVRQQSRVVKAPLAASRPNIMRSPAFTPVRDGIRVRHSEVIHIIDSPDTGFHVLSFSMNPGLDHFLWGHKIATAYDYYVYNNLTIEYRSHVSATSSGVMFMYIDSNPQDPAPNSYQTAMASNKALSTSIWTPSLKRSYPKSFFANRERFAVRAGAVENVMPYDAGVLHIGIEGVAAANAIGSIYVHYDITYMNPSLTMDNTSKVEFTLTSDMTLGSTPANVPINTVPQQIDGRLPVAISSSLPTTFKFLDDFSGIIRATVPYVRDSSANYAIDDVVGNKLAASLNFTTMAPTEYTAIVNTGNDDCSTASNILRTTNSMASDFKKGAEFTLRAAKDASVADMINLIAGSTFPVIEFISNKYWRNLDFTLS